MATPPKEDMSEASKEDEEEECEDDEADENSEEEDEALLKAKQAITCRSVTLNTLMEDGILSHGKGVLSIDYLGQRFEADLLESGKIKWHGSQEEFGTPSAWALHCKRLVNPIKRSGCGWASVKYKNRKLDIWKSMWARKHRPVNPFKSPHHISSTSTTSPSSASASTSSLSAPAGTSSSSTVTNVSSNNTATCGSATASATFNLPSTSSAGLAEHHSLSSTTLLKDNVKVKNVDGGDQLVEKDAKITTQSSKPSPSSLFSSTGSSKSLSLSKTPNTLQDEAAPLNLTTLTPGIQRPEGYHPSRRGKARHEEGCLVQERKSVAYSSLGTRGLETDLLTLIKCEQFDQHSKIQPFTVSVTSNTLLLMDFHCHLTKSEVVGYLGGRWDSHTQHLSIEQAYPARCRLGDKDRAPLVEEEIRRNMRHKNQMVVGWYHSHPYCQPDPTVKDVDCQMSYQLKMRGSSSMYFPCLGFIVSPFEKLPPKPDSKIQAFWVMPNLEHPTSYNIPMHVSYSIVRDSSLTEDLLSDMKQLTEFYRMAIDKVHIKDHWGEAITYKDKIKASLRSKLPEDQLDSGTFLDYVQQLLYDMR